MVDKDEIHDIFMIKKTESKLQMYGYNYSRAGRLNGWDEEKLALGLPLFLKKHASLWFKTLSGSENFTFEVLSQKLISHFESGVTLWQVRQKLEERRQLLEESVTDYSVPITILTFFHSALV